MARSIALVVVVSICLSLVSLASCSDFFVVGRVYCDTCRAGFETNLTTYTAGAKVQIECEDRELEHPKTIIEGSTDETGTYKILVAGEYEDDICEVVVISSPEADCNEMAPNRNRARILLAKNSGMASSIRYANSIGFLRNEPLPECIGLLKELLA